MNKEIIELMESEIITLIKELSMHQPGTKEFDDITKAIDAIYPTLNKEKSLMLEEVKIEKDVESKFKSLMLEEIKIEKDAESKIRDLELQQNVNKDNKLLTAVKYGIDIAGIVLPLAFYGVWMNRGLEFEKEGSFTSTTFKGLLGKFKPTK